MDSFDDLNENDCCGNGCANCVLNIDMKKSMRCDTTGKTNVLEKYTKFRLLNKSPHSQRLNDVLELHFKSEEPARSQYILNMKTGHHLMLRKRCIADEQSGTDSVASAKEANASEMKRMYLLRPYSPYWWDVNEMEFIILVNLKPQGPMSNYICSLQIGDDVQFRGPIGTFELIGDLNGDQQLLILSQGVAVAPIIPIIKSILYNDEDLTRITHLACFQDLDHVYFREKLYEYQKFWNYKVQIYLAHEMCDSFDCQENQRCLGNCKKFQEKLKYKEPVCSARLKDEELKKIFVKIKSTSEKVIVVIAGTGNFQKKFKDIFENESCMIFLL